MAKTLIDQAREVRREKLRASIAIYEENCAAAGKRPRVAVITRKGIHIVRVSDDEVK